VTDAVQAHPPTEFVSKDIPCLRCSYNLRGLPPDGRCPECGFWVAETIDRSGWCADRETVRGVCESTEFLIVASVLEVLILISWCLWDNAWVFVGIPAVLVFIVSGTLTGSAMVHLRDLLPRAPRKIPGDVTVLALALVVVPCIDASPWLRVFYVVFVALSGVLPAWMARATVRFSARLPDAAIARIARWTARAAVVFSSLAIAYPWFGRTSSLWLPVSGSSLYSAVDWVAQHIFAAAATAFVGMRILQVILCYRLREAVDRKFR